MLMKKLSLLLILAAGCLWGTMGLFVHTLEDADLSTMLMLPYLTGTTY